MRDRLALAVIGLLSLAVVGLVGLLLVVRAPGDDAAAVAALPALNAMLNGASAVCLAAGWIAIRARRVGVHRACMLGACALSAAFLLSYVTYHAFAGSRPFAGQGWTRWVYFPILISHIVLAAGMVPFVLTTLYRARQGDFVRHARLARWTLPVWLYVSVTGVLVYLMLYRVFS